MKFQSIFIIGIISATLTGCHKSDAVDVPYGPMTHAEIDAKTCDEVGLKIGSPENAACVASIESQ